VARNPDYWKPERSYLDGIEYTIILNRSTAILAFVAGKFDMTFPFQVTVPLMKDVKRQMRTVRAQPGMLPRSPARSCPDPGSCNPPQKQFKWPRTHGSRAPVPKPRRSLQGHQWPIKIEGHA
jgi:hypothetical protein